MASGSEYKLVEDPKLYASVDPEGIYSAMLSGIPPIMTREEVASFLRIDPKTVSALCKNQVIPGVPLPPEGSRMRIIIPKLCLIKFLVGSRSAEGEDD